MHFLRTPDDRFASLPDFDLPVHYADVAVDGSADSSTVRMAYVEAGPAQGPVVVMLHGEPSWSFLYRHAIAVAAAGGLRVIAPDLVGFGRSDKPTEIADHTYARHVHWTGSLLLDVLDLHDITLVGQDWGGLIGLRLVAEHPDRFSAVVAANTGLPTGDFDMPPIWWEFRRAMESADTLDISRFVQSGCLRGLSQAELAAYDAPFPDESFKAGPRAMPALVPTSPEDPATPANRVAWQALTTWDKPFLTAFSDSDPITAAMAPILQRSVPGARELTHPVVADAGHFLQEDAGAELGRIVTDFVHDRVS